MDSSASLSRPLFVLAGVERTFLLGQTRIHALRGIDLEIMPGEFLAVWGPSGSGKSTLMNMLGLIDAPDAGRIVFDGEEVAALSDDAKSDRRSRKIGFVFQNFNLVPVLSALENVMLPLQLQGKAKDEAAARALEWLDKVGIAALRAFRPDHLSGGQRQRVAIARALAAHPRLIIADEPTANLDSQTGHEVIDLMEKLNEETGVTCVFTTHDPRLLDRVPRQLRLIDGQIAVGNYGNDGVKK
ncbi:MAG: ABC transporter ATP-binding protein [Zoogloeaceae bacterium]|jgi:putative ABC transport system ATP-binding protein|nr:ABC transporter ATP-binding protein [Zoogloeaceae bacterium]